MPLSVRYPACSHLTVGKATCAEADAAAAEAGEYGWFDFVSAGVGLEGGRGLSIVFLFSLFHVDNIFIVVCHSREQNAAATRLALFGSVFVAKLIEVCAEESIWARGRNQAPCHQRDAFDDFLPVASPLISLPRWTLFSFFETILSKDLHHQGRRRSHYEDQEVTEERTTCWSRI